jgi:PAS domain S-box-containing protein
MAHTGQAVVPISEPPTDQPPVLSAGETRLTAELSATRRRLERALAAARMAYWDWEPVTDRLRTSGSVVNLYGLQEGESLTSRTQAAELEHPDDRERHRAVISEALAERRGWFTHYRIVRARDGKIGWIEERATIGQDPRTGTLLVTALVADVTDQRRAEEALEATRQRVERERRELRDRERRAREAAEAFLAVMSHELRQHCSRAIRIGRTWPSW